MSAERAGQRWLGLDPRWGGAGERKIQRFGGRERDRGWGAGTAGQGQGTAGTASEVGRGMGREREREKRDDDVSSRPCREAGEESRRGKFDHAQ